VYENFWVWKPAKVWEDSIGIRTCSAARDVPLVYIFNDSSRVQDDLTILLVVVRHMNRVLMVTGRGSITPRGRKKIMRSRLFSMFQ
jgi:hypothetical protein